MLTGPDLDAALQVIPSRPLAGTFLRAAPPQYAHDPLGKQRGLSAPLAAGRFNIRGGTRVLYLADSYQTCAAELGAVAGNLVSLALIAVHVRLQAVIDLRDPTTTGQLELSPAELALNFRLRPQPTPTQLFGEACARSGIIDGIFYSSLTPSGGTCLAVLGANLRAGLSGLETQNPADHLP
jgi:RES domain-containing protein